MPPTLEAQARAQIDAQLVAAGWIIQDYKAVDFSAGRGVALREVPLKTGPSDYLLLVDLQAKHLFTGKPAKSKELIKVSRPLRPTAIRHRRTRRGGAADTFCLSPSLRIAVTVDMIATGPDIKPLEVLIFLRDVRSRVYFEQMKGHGTRVLTPTDLQSVSGEDSRAKTHFVFVDAVGVCESDKTESRPQSKVAPVAGRVRFQHRVVERWSRFVRSPASASQSLWSPIRLQISGFSLQVSH